MTDLLWALSRGKDLQLEGSLLSGRVGSRFKMSRKKVCLRLEGDVASAKMLQTLTTLDFESQQLAQLLLPGD